MSRQDFSTLLFALPDFASGMGSALDMGAVGLQVNMSRTPIEADLAALRSDMLAVAADMNQAIAERDPRKG